MGNLVAKFLIDEWYKMIAFGGFVLVVLSLTVNLQIDNLLMVCVGFMLFFVGVAEMAMRPYQEKVLIDDLGRPQWKVFGRVRGVNIPGLIFYLLAIALGSLAFARAWALVGKA